MEIIVNLMTAHANDAKLVELCAKVLLNIDDNKVHFNLEQHLQLKKLSANMYYEKFYHLCYKNDISGTRTWRNTEGKVHCARKDKDGNILHAMESYLGEDKTRRWIQNGKPCSPGFDKNGHTLPDAITYLGWSMWNNEDDQEHRLEIDKDGNVLPSSTKGDIKEWYFQNVQYTQAFIQKKYDEKYSEGEKIIHKLRVSPDAKLRELCNEVLKNIENNEKHFALSQYLQSQNIDAEEYYEKFHDLCYTINDNTKRMQKCKEWRNAAGQAHCTRKDKDGNVLPARISFGYNSKSWMKDGIPWSPGFDANGYTLPTTKISTWDLWEDKDSREHRMELDKDDVPLPSGINNVFGKNTWCMHGVDTPIDIIRSQIPTRSPIGRIVFV
jgi:ribosomal protein L32E